MPINVTNLRLLGNTAFRDYVVDGNAGSGVHEPVKSEIRALIDDMIDYTEEKAGADALTTLSTSVATASATVATLSGEVSTHGTRLTALEAQVASLGGGGGGGAQTSLQWASVITDRTNTRNVAIDAINLATRVTGATGAVTFTANNLPPGLTLNSGVISGSPSVVGVSTVDVIATDSLGSRTMRFAWTIAEASAPANTPPRWYNPLVDRSNQADVAITAITLASRVEDTETATAALTFTAQNLPDGVTLNAGVISGTPTIAGSYSTRITVTDENGLTASNSFVWTIIAAPPPPIFPGNYGGGGGQGGGNANLV